MNLDLDFQGIYTIKAILKCLTGLHIGGSKERFEIGGIDNPVIKTAVSINLQDRVIKEGMPYIPGSSLKGKIRSLLEWQYGLVKAEIKNGKLSSKFIPSDKENKNLNDIAVIFGVGTNLGKEYEHLQPQPVRVKFYDAYPTKETIEKWEEELGAGLYTEVKTENAIDRITSVANPRQQERVPAGSEFEVEVVYEVFNNKDHDRLKIVLEGMKRLEDNYLGGGGSRGNGRVKFEKIEISFKSKEFYINPVSNIPSKNFNSVDEAIKNFDQIKNLSKGV